MFNPVESLDILQVMKFHLIDYHAATKTGVYKECFQAWRDVYTITPSELWGFAMYVPYDLD